MSQFLISQALSYLIELSISTVIALGMFILIEEPFRNIGKIMIKIVDSALPYRHDANVAMDENENDLKKTNV